MEIGDELHVVATNVAAYQIGLTLPNAAVGDYIFKSLSGSMIPLAASAIAEINILCIASKTYLIRAI